MNIESCDLVVVNATFTDKDGKQVDYEKAEIQFKLNGADTSIQLSGIYKPDLYIIKLYNSLINKK